MLEILNVPNIIGEAKTRADLRNSDFLDDGEWEGLINDAFTELYNDILDLKTGHFLETLDDLEADENGAIFLPNDFHKMRLVEQKLGENAYCPLIERTLVEVSDVSPTLSFYGNIAYGYVFFNDHIKIYPIDFSQGIRFRINYGKDLNIAGDRVNEIMFKYLSWKAAYLATVIDKNPNDRLMVEADKWRKSILKWASVRDSSPKVVKDLEPMFGGWY